MSCQEFSLKIITPPSIEPVTVDEVKLHTRVDGSTEDSLIAIWIKSGRELAEIYQRRAFITQTVQLSSDRFPKTPFLLPRSPVIEFKQMKYYETDNTEVIIYDADSPVGTENQYLIDIDSEPARVDLAYGYNWPATVLRPMNSFKATYVSGYGATAADVPANVKDAILMYCDWRYENRAAETRQVPEQFYDLLSGERLFHGI